MNRISAPNQLTPFEFLEFNKQNLAELIGPQKTMQTLEEVEKMFMERVKPYEERIKKLEEQEAAKKLQIAALKETVLGLNRIVDQLKLQKELDKPIPGRNSACFFQKQLRVVVPFVVLCSLLLSSSSLVIFISDELQYFQVLAARTTRPKSPMTGNAASGTRAPVRTASNNSRSN